MALGAKTHEVVVLLLRRTMVLAASGIVLGLLPTLAGARWLQTLLFDVDATDPLLLAGAISLLGAISLVAGWVPAAGAVNVAPMEILRSE